MNYPFRMYGATVEVYRYKITYTEQIDDEQQEIVEYAHTQDEAREIAAQHGGSVEELDSSAYEWMDGLMLDTYNNAVAVYTRGEAGLLAERQAARIAQSKTDLAAYLAAHPLQWTDGEYYAITAEKQQQLTSKIMSATMAQTMSADYHLTWNSTGEVCKEWTLADLTALAFAIDARVTALVTYQQTQEVTMRSASTMEELDAIEVNYDSVQ